MTIEQEAKELLVTDWEYIYYDSGNIHMETPYINGEIHGVIKQYYENGNIKAEIPYRNGRIIYDI